MERQFEALLTAVKQAVLYKFVNQMPPPAKKMGRRGGGVFETYVYEEEEGEEDLSGLQVAIEQEIVDKMNEHLYEREEADLMMELFSLDQAILMQKNEIESLKMKQEAVNLNARLAQRLPQPPQLHPTQHHIHPFTSPTAPTLATPSQPQKPRQTLLSIYPSVRVNIQKEAAHQSDRQHHTKSHRQMHAVYTKRSVASSQDQANFKRPQIEQMDRTIKNSKPAESLTGLEQQIYFLERSWKEAKREKKKDVAHRLKTELMELLQQFWAHAH